MVCWSPRCDRRAAGLRRAFALVLCAGLLACLAPQPVAAQEILPGRTAAVRRACAVDFLRYCRDVPPGRGRIMVCMQLNADKLSPRCFEAMTAWGLAAAGAFKARLPDAQKYCSHVPPGMGREPRLHPAERRPAEPRVPRGDGGETSPSKVLRGSATAAAERICPAAGAGRDRLPAVALGCSQGFFVVPERRGAGIAIPPEGFGGALACTD